MAGYGEKPGYGYLAAPLFLKLMLTTAISPGWSLSLGPLGRRMTTSEAFLRSFQMGSLVPTVLEEAGLSVRFISVATTPRRGFALSFDIPAKALESVSVSSPSLSWTAASRKATLRREMKIRKFSVPVCSLKPMG